MPYCEYGHNHVSKEVAIECERVGHFKAALSYSRSGDLQSSPSELYEKFATAWPGHKRAFYDQLSDEEKAQVDSRR